MRKRHFILLYLAVIITVTLAYPTVSFSYTNANEIISQYIIDISNDIYNSMQKPHGAMLFNSRGELRLRLLLSPWGELKDVYVSLSSDNRELDKVCLESVWMYERYQPFPEELGDDDRWVDVPMIFGLIEEERKAGAIARPFDAKAKSRLYSGLAVNQAVDIALENHMATKIAREEMELSRLKIREARRALYPAAVLNYTEVIGKTTGNTQDFKDKEYKLKFEYPLYYGWRLKYAVDQAISNMEASRHNYGKVQQDLKVEVEVAFYSYLASKANMELQRSLLEEVRKIFDTAKKRFDLELSTKAEFLQVASQLKQVTYQVTSAENDMTLAKLTLTQAMNIEDAEDLIDIDMDLESVYTMLPAEIDVTLEECMELAFRYRPELKTKKHMVEFNEYGRKIALSKDQLKVDLTGSYGKSGGAYESESLDMSEDWYLGFKVSKPLGGNTLSTSYTEDETSEKHGQSSRTESVSKSVEFGILDNLQSFSDKKSAAIALKKAKDELQQTKDGILKGVKEFFLNYKKGLIQARTNLEKIGHRKEERKIAKARAELNEIPYSGLIKAHMELTDEKSYYIEAIGSLYQSLARLNRATGYALFLDSEAFRLANVKR